MINDRALQRIYQEMGLAEDTPSNAGRRRKIRKAVEAAYPDIRSSVAAEVATPIIDAYCAMREDALELDTAWHSECRGRVLSDLERVVA